MLENVRCILVARDGAEPRDGAFEWALVLARESNAALYVVHTARARPTPPERDGVRVRTIAAPDTRNDTILAHAHLVAADLIVVGADHGTWRFWRHASVAATLGRSSHIPVLIVPRQSMPDLRGSTPLRIVAAVDFNVASAVAVRAAAALAARRSGRITLVHVIRTAPRHMVLSAGEALGVIREMRHQLRETAQRLRRAIPASVAACTLPRVASGVPHNGILDVAAEVDADLVVLGVPGRTRADEMMLGSTFRNVVRRAKRPVLAVPVVAGRHPWAGDVDAHDLPALPKAA